MKPDVHVYPVGKDHNPESRHCWCVPDFRQACPECEEKTQPNCWRCRGRGTVDVFDLEEPVMVIHHDVLVDG